MFGRGGKDLDLSSPRAKTWKYRTVESGKMRAPRTPELSPINAMPAGRKLAPASATVSAADDVEVLGRLNAVGKIGLGIAAAVAAVVLAVIADWAQEGGAWMFAAPFVFAVLFFRPILLSTIAGAVSLARHGGRAIWVSGDRLHAIDWWNGVTNLPFDRFTRVAFEPAYRHNKTTEPVLLLQRPNRKPYVVGVRHIDTPGRDLAERIEAIRAARGRKAEA